MNQDRAGKEHWDKVWTIADAPPDIDPRNPSLWAHRDQQFHRVFTEVLNPFEKKGGRLLELGCARSAWMSYFAREFGYQVAGLDYSELGVRQTVAALEHANIPADVRCADLFSPPRDWVEAFDVVAWFGVAEHFDDTAGAIRAAAAYLKPGGLLITEVPNMAGAVGWVQKWFNKPIYDIHVPLSASVLAKHHQAAGLDVLASRYAVPTDFGVVNLDDHAPGWMYRIKDRLLYGMRLFSGCVWWLDRRVGPLEPGPLTGGFVITVARKPTSSAGSVRSANAAVA
jgi:SAM-dependent methyltransferase